MGRFPVADGAGRAGERGPRRAGAAPSGARRAEPASRAGGPRFRGAPHGAGAAAHAARMRGGTPLPRYSPALRRLAPAVARRPPLPPPAPPLPSARPQPSPGARVGPSVPVRLLTGYARTEEEVALFAEDLAAVAPAKHLDWEDALDAVSLGWSLGWSEAWRRRDWFESVGPCPRCAAAGRQRQAMEPAAGWAGGGEEPSQLRALRWQRMPLPSVACAWLPPASPNTSPPTLPAASPTQFPDGLISGTAFELGGARWRLLARAAGDGRKVHLAVPDVPGPKRGGGLSTPPPPLLLTGPAGASPGSPTGSGGSGSSGGPLVDEGDGGGGALATGGAYSLYSQEDADTPCSQSVAAASASSRRKYVRDLVVATNPAHDTLGRYKALTALIEHCKGRARALRPGGGTDWGREPAHSLLHAIVDVGEALAGFGNANFPERSGEARAVLAADYKALLSEYLTHLGGVLVPGACRGLTADTEVRARWRAVLRAACLAASRRLPVDAARLDECVSSSGLIRLPVPPQAELRSVGSLLATRCAAYKVLYEQLVRHVGGEGGPGARDAPVLIFNTNNNALDASPVTHNTNAAAADAHSKAINAGISAAGLALLALSLGLVVKVLRRNGGGGGGGRDGSRLPPRPRGRNGREMRLAAVLSACGDELRKAARNDSALHDDWRLGRIRLSWPPAPEPPGYAPLAAEACDVTSVLQELYR
jgi:hypothetical protein